MRPAKFNFEPFREVAKRERSSRKRGFSVNLKYWSITFPKQYIEDNKLDGKMIRWYLDVEKKQLGWKVYGEDKALLEPTEGYFTVKKQQSTGVYQFTAKRVLNALRLPKKALTYKGLEAHTYISQYDGGYTGTIHYIDLSSPTTTTDEAGN